ncbi:DinB family protein [Cytophaga aurantiaca]|uniref:DinB family protein n=1 Tax=Cytophaga aurantiaca TaxID=29530 RepID=UPI00035FF78D|nr:DinB family protein [Cytophaga aurantiaca]
MKKEIERLKKTRIFLFDLIKDLSVEQLNKIPNGFNNNIIWNIGHLLASQQGLCYVRAGIQTAVDEQLLSGFRAQTKPEAFITAEEIETIKNKSLSALDQLEEDYNKNLFSNYTPFTTRYDIAITNIDEAIDFLLFHEGLHMGYIMAMKKNIH